MQQRIPVFNKNTEHISTRELPAVFSTQLNARFIQVAHNYISTAKRQPYAVSPIAGKQHSAESWGTGRAVARVPRVKGSGTRRAGQGAFANFCRKGRMAHPTKVTRKWQKKCNKGMRRMATAIGISASALPQIVEARGHRIEGLASIPIIIDDSCVTEITKTKDAFKLLVSLGLGAELTRVKDSKTLRPGKGKMRDRRYIRKRGILLVHTDKLELKAYKSIVGVDVASIRSLGINQLCPGGMMGRLVVWTASAFDQLSKMDKFKETNKIDENFIWSEEVVKYMSDAVYHGKGTLCSEYQ